MNLDRLKNAARLDRKIALYIPATSGPAAACDNSAEVERAAALLSEAFGGATIQPGRGAWLSPSAGLVLENTTLVYAFTTAEGLEAGIDAVVDFAEAIKEEMQQEAVSLEIDNVLYII